MAGHFHPVGLTVRATGHDDHQPPPDGNLEPIEVAAGGATLPAVGAQLRGFQRPVEDAEEKAQVGRADQIRGHPLPAHGPAEGTMFPAPRRWRRGREQPILKRRRPRHGPVPIRRDLPCPSRPAGRIRTRRVRSRAGRGPDIEQVDIVGDDCVTAVPDELVAVDGGVRDGRIESGADQVSPLATSACSPARCLGEGRLSASSAFPPMADSLTTFRTP